MKMEERACGEVCGDRRFEIINRAKKALLEATNIETSPKEMEVLDNILFRCWQMGWLDRYEIIKNDNNEEEMTLEEAARILDETPIQVLWANVTMDYIKALEIAVDKLRE